MKKKLNEIANPMTVDSIAEQLRNNASSFHRSVRNESIQLSEFKSFCNLCEAIIIIKKSDGSEIKM